MQESIATREPAVETNKKPQGFRNSKWVALFVVWGAFLVTYVLRTAWSTVAAPIGDSLGFAVSMLGSFVTAFYIGYVIANLLSGFFTDMLGGRTVLLLSLVPLGILTYAFGHIQTLMTGIIIQFFMGFSAGADYSAGMKIIATWFDKDRGRALGLYTTATSLALVLSNLIVPPLTQKYSWTIAFDVLAAGTLAWAVVSFFLLRDGPNVMQAKARRLTREDVKAVFTNRSLVLLSIAGFGGFWATVGFISWCNALMTKGHHISVLDAASVATVFGIAAVVAKPILGWLSDLNHSKRRLVSIGCFVVFIILLLGFGQLSTLTAFYIIAPFLGAAAYGYMPVLMAQISDAAGKKHAGTAAGLTNAVWQLGGAASPILVGFFYAKTTSFAIALLVLAVGPLIGMIALFFLPSVIVRKSHEEQDAEEEAAKSLAHN